MSWTVLEPDNANTSIGSLHSKEHVNDTTGNDLDRARVNQGCNEALVLSSEDLDEVMTDSVTWSSMLGSMADDSRLDGHMSHQSDNISLDMSRIGTPDSLKQLHTMAEGRAFPEMRPMMKRFLEESETSANMSQQSSQRDEFTFRSGRSFMEPFQTKSMSVAPEKADADDIPLSHTAIPTGPTTTWKRKISIALLFSVTMLGLYVSRYTATDESMVVPDPSFGSIENWIWSIKERFGLVRAEYDTEAVASALLDQMMSLQGVYAATQTQVSTPDKKLQYQPMWQYAVKVRAESNLPARDELARDLVRLGDVVSGLSEETAVFAAFYASEFSSIALEFEKLGNILLLSEKQKQLDFAPRGPYDRKPVDISSSIRSFTFAVQYRLNEMQRHVERALAPARQAVISSRNLIDTLSIDETRLRRELRGQPAWQSWGHSLKDLLVGVEGPNVREALLTDLAVSKRTIESLYPLADALEETRSRLVIQKKSIEMFSAASSAFTVVPSSGPRLSTPHVGEGHKERLVGVVAGFRKSLPHVMPDGQLSKSRY